MNRYKIVLPISVLAATMVMLLGVVIVSLANMTLVRLAHGIGFKLQVSAGAACIYMVMILSFCVATYYLLRRR